MAFENIGKILGNIASTTAKKAGEQVQITKLGMDRAGIERQIEGVYAAMGRYCYSRVKAGDDMPEELHEYCRDIDVLMDQIKQLEGEIKQHKSERDSAEYIVAADMNGAENVQDIEYSPAEEIAADEVFVQEPVANEETKE